MTEKMLNHYPRKMHAYDNWSKDAMYCKNMLKFIFKYDMSKEFLKILAFLFFHVLASLSHAQENKINVTVNGLGSSYDEALKNALTNATSEAYGILVLTERRVKGERLEQDDISYSQGVIEGYTILNKSFDNKSHAYLVEISAQVSKSFVEKRLLGTYDSSKISGSEISDAIRQAAIKNKSEADRHNQARNLLFFLSRDFPQNLYEITNGKIHLSNSDGQISLSLQVHISYKRSSINELCKVVQAYQNSRLSSIDADLKNITGLMYINNGNKTFFDDGCSAIAFIDDEIYKTLIGRAYSAGVCLRLYDETNQEISKIFYKFSEADYKDAEFNEINLSPGLGNITIWTNNIPNFNQSIILSKRYLIETKFRGTRPRKITADEVISATVPVSTLVIEHKKFDKPVTKYLSLPHLSNQQIERISRTYSRISLAERC